MHHMYVAYCHQVTVFMKTVTGHGNMQDISIESTILCEKNIISFFFFETDIIFFKRVIVCQLGSSY